MSELWRDYEKDMHKPSEHTVRFARYPEQDTTMYAKRNPDVIEIHDATMESMLKGPKGIPSLTESITPEQATANIFEHENMHQILGKSLIDVSFALDNEVAKALSHSQTTKQGYAKLLQALDHYYESLGVPAEKRAFRFARDAKRLEMLD